MAREVTGKQKNPVSVLSVIAAEFTTGFDIDRIILKE